MKISKRAVRWRTYVVAFPFAVLPLGQRALAGTVNGGSQTVNAPGDPSESWTVTNGGALTVTNGAATNAISVQTGSSLTADGATIIRNTTGGSAVDIRDQSTGTITNSNITNQLGSGLSVSGLVNTTAPYPTATVTGGSITGTWAGATVATNGTLTLNNVSVTNGTALQSGFNAAVGNFGSTLITNGGTITGDKNGVWVTSNRGNPAAVGSTTIKGTAVVSRTGSAILVQSETSRLATNANILVADGATLTSGNGTALEANGNVTANTTFDNAQIKGNVVGDGTATINLTLQNNATFTGDLTKVTSLAVNSNATWLLTTNSSVPTMTMNGGNVALSQGASNGGYRVLTVGALSGTGTFQMNANLGADAGDLLNVTGNATGNYQLKIRNTGAEPSTAAPLTVVRTGGGDAQFSAVGTKVDVGVYTYTLGRQGNDWVLSPSSQSSSGGNNGPTELSASARTAIGISSVAPTIWYAETNVLRSRLGELRLKDGKNSGVWARAFGKQYRSRPVDGVDFRQTTYGVVGGADLSLGQFFGGTWLAGVLLGTSHSNLTFDGGSKGGVDSYTAGLYSTWLGASGYYLDGTLRFNRFQNDADARMNDGAPAHGGFQNNGVGLTLEFGRHIEFGNSWFVEPYIQGSMLRTGGADFTLDNALSSRSQHTGSVQARVGAALGKTLELSNGVVLQPYVKAAVAQEFIKNSRIEVNGVPFQSDMSGARFEFGAGMSGYAKRNLQFYGEVETSTGRHVNQPWGIQFGTRYTF